MNLPLPCLTVLSLTTAGAVVAGLLAGTAPSAAAPGTAPPPVEHRVVAGVHADAVATFLDGGDLVLGTSVDEPRPGTRVDPSEVWFHLEDAAATTLPAGMGFVGAEGSRAWIAPEANPGEGRLWPGFSTEGVPAGGVDGDRTRLVLDDLEGPGDLEVYATAGGGEVQRLWSSDEGIDAFTLGRAHRHANWAFTAPGSYRLSVTAEAAIGGAPTSASATYTVVVGDLPEAVATTTALTASRPAITRGEPVTLSAAVTPAVPGYVEFRDGTAVLGHEPVADGRAQLTVPDLGPGERSLTAAYVPEAARVARPSTSTAVTVRVTDASGVPFGIADVRETYAPGDRLAARVVGHVLEEGESYRWLIRPVGITTSSYVLNGTGDQAATGFLEQVLDASYHDYEISVRLRRGSANLAQTGWVPLRVPNAVAPVPGAFQEAPAYLGDDVAIRVQPRPLAEGESLRLAYRGTYSPWFPAADLTEQVDASTFAVRTPYPMTGVTWTVQVVRDGLVLAQSAPFAGDVNAREVMVEGLRGVYRVGQTLRATATVHPAKEGMGYHWFTLDPDTFELTTLQRGTDDAARTLELPMTMDLHDVPLHVEAEWDDGSGAAFVGSSATVLKVSDTDPSTQLLFFENLGEHYHQGGPVNLRLVADPPLADGDTIAWDWRWPGSDEWTTLPGASGAVHTLTAEQALDGVEVRGTLSFASGGELAAEPVTVHVDDHGSPARQSVTVTGATSYVAGAPATLTAGVAPSSVLDRYRWERRAAGEADYVTLDGETGAELSFTATAADDGADYRAALVTPTGRPGYGPSDPVRLEVGEAPTGPAATTVSAAPGRQVYGRPARLPVTVSGGASGVVTVQAGGRTLSAPVARGAAVVALPARVLAPGRHRLTLSFADGSGRFATSSARVPVAVAKARPRAVLTPARARVAAGRRAVVRLRLTAPGVVPGGRAVVRVAGGARAVRLDARGRARAVVLVPRSTRAGAWRVRVTYAGDRYVAGRRWTAGTVRVVRPGAAR